MPRTGAGRVYLRGNVWWIQYGHRGETHRESSDSTRKGAAHALLKKRIAEIENGQFVGPKADKVTFSDLVEHLRADYRKNDRRTWGRAHLSIRHLQDYFGADALARDITPARINAYILHRMDETAASATIRRELAALSRMFALAVEFQDLPSKPKIPTLEVSNIRKGFLDGAELEAVIEELPDYLQPVVRFAALTGWRRGEVLPLTWSQVDFSAGTIRLEPGTTKNKDGRTFPFRVLPPLAELLDARREYTRQVERETETIVPYVFHRDGKPILDLRAAWASACTRAEVPGMLFHDLRRTAVRNLVRAGVPEKTAMKLVGHKTRSIFDRYNIVDEADLTDGVEKLAQRLANQEAGTRKVVPIAKQSSG
jgi:integrase